METTETHHKITLGVSSEGGAVRRAVSRLDHLGLDLALCIRRTIPFLAKRGIKITHAQAHIARYSEVVESLEHPLFAAHLAVEPGGSRAAILLDAGAAAYLLEGLLGGDGTAPPVLDPEGLTAPQVALLGRIAEKVITGLSDVLEESLRIRLSRLPPNVDAPNTGTFVVTEFQIGPEEVTRKLVFIVAKEVLRAESPTSGPRTDDIDPRVVQTLGNVELELVAELGRVRMSLGELMSLRPGDTLRLDVPVNGVVHIRAEENLLWDGHPTTAGSQIAIRILRRHEP